MRPLEYGSFKQTTISFWGKLSTNFFVKVTFHWYNNILICTLFLWLAMKFWLGFINFIMGRIYYGVKPLNQVANQLLQHFLALFHDQDSGSTQATACLSDLLCIQNRFKVISCKMQAIGHEKEQERAEFGTPKYCFAAPFASSNRVGTDFHYQSAFFSWFYHARFLALVGWWASSFSWS